LRKRCRIYNTARRLRCLQSNNDNSSRSSSRSVKMRAVGLLPMVPKLQQQKGQVLEQVKDYYIQLR
jgi:hypothetical protein